MKMSSHVPHMFERLSIVERKSPFQVNSKLRNVVGYFILGIRSKFMPSTILICSKQFARQLQDVACQTREGVSLSLGIILLTLTIPGLFLKIMSGEVPPFISARIISSIILSALGLLFIAVSKNNVLLLIGVGILSYSYGLREITYSQLSAFFPKGIFKAWTCGTILSSFIASLVFIIFNQFINNLEEIMLLYLVFPVLEIFTFTVIINNPVQISVVVIERVEDRIEDKKTVEMWQPALVSDQFRNIRYFWRILLSHGIIVWMNSFNLQGSFEALRLPNIENTAGYHSLFILYSFGNILGGTLAAVYKTRYIWICMILEVCTTSIFGFQLFFQFIPYNMVISAMAIFEGLLVAYSYVNLLNYLCQNISHNHPDVMAFTVISLVESAFSILAGLSIYPLHKFVCI